MAMNPDDYLLALDGSIWQAPVLNENGREVCPRCRVVLLAGADCNCEYPPHYTVIEARAIIVNLSAAVTRFDP